MFREEGLRLLLNVEWESRMIFRPFLASFYMGPGTRMINYPLISTLFVYFVIFVAKLGTIFAINQHLDMMIHLILRTFYFL